MFISKKLTSVEQQWSWTYCTSWLEALYEILKFKQRERCLGTGKGPGTWPQFLLGWISWGWPEPVEHRWCGVERREAVEPAKAPQVPSIWISPLWIPLNGGLFLRSRPSADIKDGQWPQMSIWKPIKWCQNMVGKQGWFQGLWVDWGNEEASRGGNWLCQPVRRSNILTATQNIQLDTIIGLYLRHS